MGDRSRRRGSTALAAGLAQQLRDEGKPIPCGQALVYPALDDRSEKYPSAAISFHTVRQS